MNNSVSIEDELLKCDFCSLPLSIPPIFYNADLGHFCGRCKNSTFEDHDQPMFERQYLYEKLAKNLIFPCRFFQQGCRSKLKWDNAFKHEQRCSFKMASVICPLSCDILCSWKGDSNNLSQHLRQTHQTYFRKSSEVILSRELKNEFVFFEFNRRITLFQFDYSKDINNYYSRVCCDMDLYQDYSYDIHISSENSMDVTIFSGGKLQGIFGSITNSTENCLVIPYTTIEELFRKFDNIIIKVCIKKTNPENNPSRNSLTDLPNFESSELNSKIMKELECPICSEFMVPPINECRSGHSVCNKCKIKIERCPICRELMSDGRSITLEKVASNIKFSCYNKTKGCNYLAPILILKQHQLFCYLGERDCLISSCQWHGRIYELPDHLEDNHYFFDLGRINTYPLEKKFEEYMFLFDDKIFLLCIQIVRKKFIYSMLCFGGGDILQYRYELKILDYYLEYNEIVLSDFCQPVGYNFDRGDFLRFALPFSMLNRVVNGDNYLYFQVHIKECK